MPGATLSRSRDTRHTSEHQRRELRSEAAGNVNGSPVCCKPGNPIERAAVDEWNLDSIVRPRGDLKTQALVVVRMLEGSPRD